MVPCHRTCVFVQFISLEVAAIIERAMCCQSSRDKKCYLKLESLTHLWYMYLMCQKRRLSVNVCLMRRRVAQSTEPTKTSTTTTVGRRTLSLPSDQFYTSKSADLLMHTVEKQKQKIFSWRSSFHLSKCSSKHANYLYAPLKSNPEDFKFYTGITIENFENVKRLVGVAAQRM